MGKYIAMKLIISFIITPFGFIYKSMPTDSPAFLKYSPSIR